MLVSHPLVPPLTQRTFSHIQENPPWSQQLHTHMHTSDHVQETSAICPHSVTRCHIAPASISHPRISTKTTSTRTFLDICAVFDVPLISRQNYQRLSKQRASAKVECTRFPQDLINAGLRSSKKFTREILIYGWGGRGEGKTFCALGLFVRVVLTDAGCVLPACSTF